MSEELVADIRLARTLPSEFYTDESHFEAQRNAFKSTWQLMGASSQFMSAVSPMPHLDTLLGVPLVRTNDGVGVRVLSNVCTHRGMVICHEETDKKTLQCPYHGRTFGCDGRMKHMPGFEEALDFPTAADHLTVFHHSNWSGFEFMTVNAEVELDAVFQPVQDRIGWFLDGLQYDVSGDRVWDIAAHWMLYVDNYLRVSHSIRPSRIERRPRQGRVCHGMF